MTAIAILAIGTTVLIGGSIALVLHAERERHHCPICRGRCRVPVPDPE
jgi:hypothetical protein